jgi:hypothetical protein
LTSGVTVRFWRLRVSLGARSWQEYFNFSISRVDLQYLTFIAGGSQNLYCANQTLISDDCLSIA